MGVVRGLWGSISKAECVGVRAFSLLPRMGRESLWLEGRVLQFQRGDGGGSLQRIVAAGPTSRMLPEDYCKKDPCNFNTEMFVSKVGNPCPTLGQLLVSRILCALLVKKNSTKSLGQDFVHRVAQKLANS